MNIKHLYSRLRGSLTATQAREYFTERGYVLNFEDLEESYQAKRSIQTAITDDVLSMYVAEGLTYSEIARIVGISRQAVQQRVSRIAKAIIEVNNQRG